MTKLLGMMVLIFSVGALAGTKSQPPPGEMFDYPIRKETRISVESFDVDSGTYKVNIEKESAVGPNYTTLDYLNKAIHFSNVSILQKNPEKIIGNTYQLQEKLILISQKAVDLRKSKSSGAGKKVPSSDKKMTKTIN